MTDVHNRPQPMLAWPKRENQDDGTRVSIVALAGFQGEERDPDTGRLVRHAAGDEVEVTPGLAAQLIGAGKAARAGTPLAEGALRRWGGK